jgi:hypothetical protein
MKLTELIKTLQSLRKTYGDLEVVIERRLKDRTTFGGVALTSIHQLGIEDAGTDISGRVLLDLANPSPSVNPRYVKECSTAVLVLRKNGEPECISSLRDFLNYEEPDD